MLLRNKRYYLKFILREKSATAPSVGRRHSARQRQKAKSELPVLRTTSATAVRTAKRDNIIDCFCRALPNGVHSVPAVGRWSGPSYGGPARSPSSPPSCRPAVAGLRRGFGHRHSVWRAWRPVQPHFAVAPDVVCNGSVRERQKAAARPGRQRHKCN